ncbi:MAG: energy transducer TonB [Luteibaculaceae bacterium]
MNLTTQNFRVTFTSFFVVALLFLASSKIQAQTPSVEIPPSFPGGDAELFKFLSSNIKYPKIAKEQNLQGTVYSTFVVDKTGIIRDIKITKGIGEACDNEVLRVISLMPNWEPGTQNGEPINSQYKLPIRFTMPEEIEEQNLEEKGKKRKKQSR